jgi:DNA polymerase elongation subunit (family B)
MSEKPSIEFQIYDWIEDHFLEKDDEDSGTEQKYKAGEFIIHAFGRTMEGKSVYAKILKFTPYFYVQLPKQWDGWSDRKLEKELECLKEHLKRYEKKIWTKFKDTLLDIDLVEGKDASTFTNETTFKFARLKFNNADGMKKFKVFFEENDVEYKQGKDSKLKFKTYEANLPPMFRCFHNRNITGCAWVECSKYIHVKNETKKESHCDIELNVKWRDLNAINKDMNAPFRIASFDIECFSHDGQFPQANRKLDQIIQIGVTYTYIGQSEPYRQYIGCLNETLPFDDITDLRSFDSETGLILDFKRELIESDCDIITGYNIFYFDEKYIYDRCDTILDIKDEMGFISKLKNKFCTFKEMKLASSALGENLLRFWDTPGRVHIDLMKDVQKTFNLPSFKLDFVASNFIRGEVKNFKIIEDKNCLLPNKKEQELLVELDCATVDDITLYDYIHLESIKGFVSDEVGEKYVVASIDKPNKKLLVIGDNFLEQELKSAKETVGGKIFWSQAKDDVGPKEIFKFFKGTPKERSIVAKYCIKDCKLVNLLMNKLEVVTKNIEMANVCSVPLSYLFIRGQGIKIFSLCLKEFKNQGYVFPVIKMNRPKLCKSCNLETTKYACPICKNRNLEDIESDDWFEGAIVFEPVPKVDYEAYVTKDYNSLYPSSIIQKNMSHETIVEREEFDNLPGIKYYNANYVESDGTIQYRRYAQKDGKLGVIPSILDKLLKERKAVKKQMEKEEIPFKKKILDAKQLALKVTANSLYGQLGAATSPVCKKDIAACTTSTGREMLILGKKYDEEILPWLMNGMRKALENEDEESFNKFLDWELKARDNKQFIEDLKKYLLVDMKDKTIQPVVRYGDSVIGDTPLILKNSITNEIFIKTISELGNKWQEMADRDGKESCELNNLQSWTETGWTNIKRVIRHKIDKNKKLVAVITNNSFVVVTDEHSLLDSKCKVIKPSELKLKTRLLNILPPYINYLDGLSLKEGKKYNTQKEALEHFLIATNYDAYPDIIYKDGGWYLQIKSWYDSWVVDIQDWEKEEEYVYDLTTENNHFQAGIGCLIVHNTDSNFSCYRFREDVVPVDKKESLRLWKEIIKFSKELIKPFIPEEHQNKWVQLHEKYYDVSKIKKLELPESPEVLPQPNHWKIILPIEERLKQLLKEYMEETYLAWMWSLQEVITRNFNNIDYKLCNWGNHQMTKIKLVAENISDEKLKGYTDRIKAIDVQIKKTNEKIKKEGLDKSLFQDEIDLLNQEKEKHKKEYDNIFEKRQNLENMVKEFSVDTLQDYWIQPYWKVENDKKKFGVEFFKGGKMITDKRSLDLSMEMGKISGELIRLRLPFPHNFAYEKTFWPFLILCKKKYVGNKYEDNPNKYKQDFMGIVLKRRDNAPIVKEICGGIIDILINKRDPEGAKDFLRKCLDNMFEGKYDIKYFLQSRTLKLKESYKDWTKIGHVYLSEKIAQRDPGNKPQSGDRIEFAVVKVKNDDPKKKLLQGELIETPAFIKQNNKEVDYLFYMTNQIQNPATQFLELVDSKIGELFEEYIIKYGTPKPVKVKKEPIKKEDVPKKPRTPRKKIIKVLNGEGGLDEKEKNKEGLDEKEKNKEGLDEKEKNKEIIIKKKKEKKDEIIIPKKEIIIKKKKEKKDEIIIPEKEIIDI